MEQTTTTLVALSLGLLLIVIIGLISFYLIRRYLRFRNSSGEISLYSQEATDLARFTEAKNKGMLTPEELKRIRTYIHQRTLRHLREQEAEDRSIWKT